MVFPCADAASFIAEGVDVNDLAKEGSRFYDAAKGINWGNYNQTIKDIWEKDRNWSQFGKLEQAGKLPYLGLGVNVSSSYFVNLRQDYQKCWAYTSSNVIQYWQDVYGQFYTGNKEDLPTGLTYSRENLEKFGGIQSTSMSLLFYQNTNDEGGDSSYAFEWYLRSGSTTRGDGTVMFTNATSSGGYFREYFTSNSGGNSWTYGYGDAVDLGEWTQEFAKALGCTLGEDGQYHVTSEGQIAYVSLRNNGGGQHAMTCYGFETDDNGNLTAVYMADSDNADGYKLDKYYVGMEGNAYLYTDEALTQSSGYYLNSLAYINTPDSLKRMLAGSRADVLEWGEGSGDWVAGLASNSHWKAQGVDAEFAAGKDAVFQQAASNRNIEVKGTVEAGAVTVETGQGLTDTFTTASAAGTADAAIQATSYVKKGEGKQEMAVKLETKSLSLQGGELELTNQGNGVMGLTKLELATDTVFSAYQQGAEGSLMEVSLAEGSSLIAGEGVVMHADLSLAGASLTLGGALSMHSSTLSLGTGNTLLGMSADGILATGVSCLTLMTSQGEQVFRLGENAAADATAFFGDTWEGYTLYYNAANGGTVGVALAPEPASATLSLLALAGLALRRSRRK